jgi:FtsP/CotA-like multicopper oxidase with cupredoxin domain
MNSKTKIGVKTASGQTRFKLLTSAAMIAMALASMSAIAGPGKVCIDLSTPVGNACADGSAPIGTYYANSPQLRKFVDTVAGLTSAGKNTFANGTNGEYISVAEPDTKTYPGSEYFVIGVIEHMQRLHSDLQKETTLRSYVQLYPSVADGGVFDSKGVPVVKDSAYKSFGAPKPGAPVALTYPSGKPIYWPGTTEQVYGLDKAHYLGPIIITSKGTPVRVKFVNFLPNGTATTTTTVSNGITTKNVTARNGDMFLPTDESLAGAGLSADNTNKYPQNRVSFHLHGGDSPWISDGTPHQWIAASGENLPPERQHGDRFMNAPDMPYPGDGAQNTFWPNDQSNRLMWYHDHTFGLTRQNAYSGAAAGYVIYDDAEVALIYGGTVNGVTINKAIPNTLLDQIVLVVQDKTFVPDDIAVQDSKWDQNAWGKPGDLWYPHVYEPFQIWDKGNSLGGNPGDLFPIATSPAFANPAGRWDYAVDDATGGYRVPNAPLRDDPDYGRVAFPDGTYTGGPSATPESYMDTPVVNGIAYPVLNVDPKAYRVRFLNGANDRYWNLSLWLADSTVTSTDGRTNTEIKMVPEVVPSAIAVTSGGAGYVNPQVTIVDSVTNGTGRGAVATATVDATGAITAITLVNSGSGYVNPQVVITEAGRVAGSDDAVVTLATVAGRDGGIPDPTYAGPNIIRFANEGGLLAAPVVHTPKPMTGFMDPLAGFTLARDTGGDFYLGGAERADTVIDFSQFAGQTLIVYNDSSAPVPGGDSRYDYYTGDADQTTIGGAPSTLPGYGPNTRTVMQIRVAALPANAKTPAAYDPQGNGGPLATELPKAFAASVDAHIVASKIQPVSTDAASRTLTWSDGTTSPLQVKTIQGFTDPNFGRLIAQIGTELTSSATGTATPLGYIDKPTDIISDGETQYWWIKNNDVDNHPMHFHLFNVQVIGRLDHATGTIVPPQPDETGWKETIKNWPLEDVIVAVKPKTPALPFGLPKSVRNLDPTLPAGASNASFSRPGADMLSAFYQNDVVTGLPIPDPADATKTLPVVNSSYDFDWEYVWHCHILGHEENDLMRPLVFHPVPPTVPTTVPTIVSIDANGKVTWTDPTPALDSTGAAVATTKGNTDNEIGFRVERAPVTTSNASGTPTTGTFAALAPTSPVVDGRVNTLANAIHFQDAPAKYADYAYRVVSVNEAGEAMSAVASLVQAPAPATGLAVALTPAPTARTLTLNWTDNSSNEEGFSVEASAAGGAWAIVAGAPVSANVSTLAVTGLTPATVYQFRVAPTKAALAGYLPAYATVNYTTPVELLAPVVTVKSSVNATTGAPLVTVTWTDTSTGETAYTIERSVKGTTVWTLLNAASAPNSTSYTDASAIAGTTYFYRVKAMNGTTAGPIGTSNQVTASPVVAAPTNLSAATATGAVVLTWTDNSTNETGFNILRSPSGANTFAQIGTVAKNIVTFTDATVGSGIAYDYQVVAVYTTTTSTSTSTPSNTATVTSPLIAAPVVTANVAAGTMVLNWVDNTTNETNYQITRNDGAVFTATATSRSTTLKAATGGAVTYTDTTAVPNVAYSYTVRAITSAAAVLPVVVGEPSNLVTATVVMAAPGAPTAVLNSATKVTVTWADNSNNETGFVVERSINGGTWTPLLLAGQAYSVKAGTTATASYADTLVAPVQNGTYQYRVSAVKQTGTGTTAVTTATAAALSASNVLDVSLPAAPTGLSVTPGATTTVNVSWTDNATNETGFTLQRATDAAFTKALTTTKVAAAVSGTGSVYNLPPVTGLKKGTTYYFRVAATNVLGASGYSTAASIVAP